MISSDNPDEDVPNFAGLILIGGKSRRMKRDKSTLNYRGKAHREYLADLLFTFTPEVFFSGSPGTNPPSYPKVGYIADSISGAGPLGGIISAHLQYPNLAFLVVACDLPFIDSFIVNELVSQRNPMKMATAFRHPNSDFVEPLFSIYEPRGLKEMALNLQKGEKSPSKLLLGMPVEWLSPDTPEKLANVNDPVAMGEAIAKLRH